MLSIFHLFFTSTSQMAGAELIVANATSSCSPFTSDTPIPLSDMNVAVVAFSAEFACCKTKQKMDILKSKSSATPITKPVLFAVNILHSLTFYFKRQFCCCLSGSARDAFILGEQQHSLLSFQVRHPVDNHFVCSRAQSVVSL